jgi:subtilisin family serine protease
VGATQFLDTGNPAAYWALTNDPVTKASALSYIPEKTWNESGGPCGPLCASGGGASVFYAKPSWQMVVGVPAADHRYVPDVSVAGATHDAYLTIVNGMSGLAGFGGTSVSSPALAGMFALVVQRFGAQGNPNPRLYRIAGADFSGVGVPAVFHDVTEGDNTVPGATGFPAGPGFDEATGLGSVDAGALVARWGAAPPSAPRMTPVKVDRDEPAVRVRPFR